MDEELRREIIMEHYMQPEHRHRPNDEDYEKVNTNNESCIDNLDIYVKIKEGMIEDICFEGEACAISTSSTSIMIHNLIGKSVSDAKEYIENFEHMLNEKEYKEEILKEANAYNEIYKQGNRKHCAFLPYEGILKVLKNYDATESKN